MTKGERLGEKKERDDGKRREREREIVGGESRRDCGFR